MSKARILADLGNTTADHAELSKLDGVPVGLTFDEFNNEYHEFLKLPIEEQLLIIPDL